MSKFRSIALLSCGFGLGVLFTWKSQAFESFRAPWALLQQQSPERNTAKPQQRESSENATHAKPSQPWLEEKESQGPAQHLGERAQPPVAEAMPAPPSPALSGKSSSIYNCAYKIPLKEGIPGSMKGRTKMAAVLDLLVDSLQVHGDIVEAGVAKGGSSLTLLSFLGCTGHLRNRTFHLFDTWTGLPKSNVALDGAFREGQFLKTYDQFMANVEVFKKKYEQNVMGDGKDELIPPNALSWDETWSHVRIHKGLFGDTMPSALAGRDVALLMCDGDMYSSSMDCMSAAVPHVVRGGWIYNDDYFRFEANYQAVQDYRQQTKVDLKSRIYLVPAVLHKGYIVEETCSECHPPRGLNSPAGKCLGQDCEACFWQHDR